MLPGSVNNNTSMRSPNSINPNSLIRSNNKKNSGMTIINENNGNNSNVVTIESLNNNVNNNGNSPKWYNILPNNERAKYKALQAQTNLGLADLARYDMMSNENYYNSLSNNEKARLNAEVEAEVDTMKAQMNANQAKLNVKTGCSGSSCWGRGGKRRGQIGCSKRKTKTRRGGGCGCANRLRGGRRSKTSKKSRR